MPAAVAPRCPSDEAIFPFDEQAFQARVTRHLPLVRSIVDRLKRRLPPSVEAEDLYGVGVTALVTAARNCRVDQDGSFGAYASTRIRGALLDELRRLDWMSRAGRFKAKRLAKATARLEQEQGGAASRAALCAEMHLGEGELQDLMDDARPVRMVSLDSPETQGDAGEPSLHELIADDGSISAFEAVERKDMIALLAERIATLPDMPKKVLAMYYYENLRLADIAACFGLTESRICQIHTQAVKHLRAQMAALLA